MSNYLKTIEFNDSESMRTVLVAAKLAIEPDVWRKINSDVHIDEDELTVWTEADHYRPVEQLWSFVFEDFDWGECEFEEPEQTEIQLSEYFEDAAETFDVTQRVDQLIEYPNLEFSHGLYNGDINRYLGDS